MSIGSQRFNEMVRRVARQEAHRVSPPPRKFRVVKVKPFTLEALGSDARLVEGDDDFEIDRFVKKEAGVGDTVLVSTDGTGDHTAHGLI